ncbi:Ankyrin repeat family protein, partial [Prunus dulcis]
LCWTTWRLVPGRQAPGSSASSVAQPASARRRHRPTNTIDTTSTDGTGASGSQPAKKNTRGPCRQLKTAKVTRVTNSRISIGYDERHRAAPTAESHSSLAHDIGHVVRTHCPMQWKSWRVMPDEIKAEVHGQLSEGSKFLEIDVFGDVYVRPGNELAESLHTTMVERSQLVLQESASQLPPETPISLWLLHSMLDFRS